MTLPFLSHLDLYHSTPQPASSQFIQNGCFQSDFYAIGQKTSNTRSRDKVRISVREWQSFPFLNIKLLDQIIFRLSVSFTEVKISKKNPTGLLSVCLKQWLYIKGVLPAVIKERDSRASLLVQTCRRVGRDECQSVDTVLVSASMTWRTADALGHQQPNFPSPCA